MAVASGLMGTALNEADFYDQLVALTGEESALHTMNGHWIFVDSVRLLLRVVGALVIVIPEGLDELTGEVRKICETSYVRQKPRIFTGNLDVHLSGAKIVLNIGQQLRQDLPWISVSANGWLCRATTGSRALDGDLSRPNPISSLFAASIGVSEVFKRLIGMSADAAPPIEDMMFSLFDFQDDGLGIGPEFPNTLDIPNTLLVGGGAIGSGIALLAAQLGLKGRIHVVDKQAYGDENMGTCVLMERRGWSGQDKAVRLADWISMHGLAIASGEKGFIADAAGGEKCCELAPRIVINGLDDVSARHDAQMLWPDVIFDGGINNLGVAVVQHRLDEYGKACLRCTFKLPEIDIRALQADLTGLDGKTLNDPNRALTAKDIERAAPEKREWLRQHMTAGKTICSIVSEATMAKYGVSLGADFRPSVPFVATAAACLVMAELIKFLLDPGAQYHHTSMIGSLFLGSKSSALFNRTADPNCLCVRCREAIIASKASFQSAF